MKRHSLPASLALVLLVAAACIGNEQNSDPAAKTVVTSNEEVTTDDTTPDDKTDAPMIAEADESESGGHGASEHPVQFDSAAFPPTLPFDDSHADAWMQDDCILCHESGIQDAPIVKHTGMSKDLLGARCRTCHVNSPPPDQDEVEFSRHAFPPILPSDDSHSNGWLRDDCILCHSTGVADAPLVVHQGMSDLLLQARCRSCHIPGASSDSGN